MFKYLSILCVLATVTQQAHSATLDNDGIEEIEGKRVQKLTLHFTWPDIEQAMPTPCSLPMTIGEQETSLEVSCGISGERLRPHSMPLYLKIKFSDLYTPFTYNDILKAEQCNELAEKYHKLQEEQYASIDKVSGRDLIGDPIEATDTIPAKFIVDMQLTGTLGAGYTPKAPEFQLGRDVLGRNFLETTEHQQFSKRVREGTGYTILPFFPTPSLIHAPLPDFVALKIVQH